MYPQKIKSFLKDYFTLTSRERKGALALATLIFVQLTVIIWLNYIRSPSEPALDKSRIQIIKFVQRQNKNFSSELNENQNHQFADRVKQEIKLSFFDPNTINDSLWMQLGFSLKQTAIVRNYLNKGGSFRKKEDLAKIFSVTEQQYSMVEPYIRIVAEPRIEKFSKKDFEKSKQQQKQLNINAADTTELCSLPLIGPGRARMIYKYRNALGGFVDEKQLLEVFTIDSTVLEAISSKIFIDKSLIQKFNINGDFRHPYVSKQLSYTIKAFRKEHGNFVKLEDLKQISVLNDDLIGKLAPYVAFE